MCRFLTFNELLSYVNCFKPIFSYNETKINASEIKNLDIGRSGIVNNEGEQTFYIDFNYSSAPIDSLKLDIDYFTEDGYVFIQDIIVWKER
ncbi:hypothetical protein J2Y38_002106 [Flavobacterium sp. 2755]|nr:hypothetical protein [Flavobacterium sp. 2755]